MSKPTGLPMLPRVTLKSRKEKPVLAHHPWIFSGSVARADDANDGDTVDIFDAAGNFLARGYYNSHSQIAVRIWTWQNEPVDRALLRARLERARDARAVWIDPDETDAYRVVNAESDSLPGLIVDRYADYLVAQFLTLGVEKRKTEIIELLADLYSPRGVYERSDAEVREKEGLPPSTGVLHGDAPPAQIQMRESNLRFLVDIQRGHKTGFYLDQRENRRRVGEFIAQIRRQRNGVALEVLNVFSYTGAVAVYACAADGAARVINLDASGDALDLARVNLRLSGFENRSEFIEGDAFQLLRKFRDQARSFDVIILDPPKFVHSRAQLDSGLRGYKDLNLLAFKLLKSGGILVTFSCSGQLSTDLFQKVVFGAALDAQVDARIIARLSQSSDHPVLLSFPESEYLKGLVCHI